MLVVFQAKLQRAPILDQVDGARLGIDGGDLNRPLLVTDGYLQILGFGRLGAGIDQGEARLFHPLQPINAGELEIEIFGWLRRGDVRWGRWRVREIEGVALDDRKVGV
ncbi:MAG: hypothetical protein ACI8QI_001415 [Limisphaerales bacterium]|nr:MAG: hypothetical protein COC21_04665 [Verrucomicrobiales bacterium]